jgi:hypothetical protein
MRRMPSRVMALFLVAVLLWSGLHAVELPRTDAPASPAQMVAVAHAVDVTAAHEGSVEHHHLDDLLSQALSEPPPETPGLLAAPQAPSARWMATVQPLGLASAGAGAPFLAGPLRPPCDAALLG